MKNGHVHHRELMCRIFDGTEEVISAEYLPMVLQFDSPKSMTVSKLAD